MRRFNQEEDDILLKAISQHPHNLQEAFRITSIATRRSIGVIQQHWYNQLSKKASPLFMMIGSTTSTINRKVGTTTHPVAQTPITEDTFSKIVQAVTQNLINYFSHENKQSTISISR